jgi:hypothetical protein
MIAIFYTLLLLNRRRGDADTWHIVFPIDCGRAGLLIRPPAG